MTYALADLLMQRITIFIPPTNLSVQHLLQQCSTCCSSCHAVLVWLQSICPLRVLPHLDCSTCSNSCRIMLIWLQSSCIASVYTTHTSNTCMLAAMLPSCFQHLLVLLQEQEQLEELQLDGCCCFNTTHAEMGPQLQHQEEPHCKPLSTAHDASLFESQFASQSILKGCVRMKALLADEFGVCVSLMHSAAAAALLTPFMDKREKLLCIRSCWHLVCPSYLYLFCD